MLAVRAEGTMDEANGWARRVDQMTMATTHEQLRSVVREVEAAMQRFGAEAFQQYGMMVESQRALEADVARKIEEETRAAVEMLRTEREGRLSEIEDRIDQLNERIAQLHERLDAEATKAEDRHGVLLGQLGRVADMEDRMASRMVNLLFAAARRMKGATLDGPGEPDATSAPVQESTASEPAFVQTQQPAI